MGEKIDRIIADESFQRWLSGIASPSESKKWERWLTRSSENKELFQKASWLWNAGRFESTQHPPVNEQWKKLYQRVQDHSSSDIDFVIHMHHHRHIPFRYSAVAIAACLMMVFIYLFVVRPYSKQSRTGTNYHRVSTDFGQRATITMSDGTYVILNANSSLTYPEVWYANSPRTVRLVGEAYFDVAKNDDGLFRKFIVTTVEGQIEVMGTKFAVYERGHGTRVVLEEGSLKIFAFNGASDKKLSNMKLVLKPGQLVQFRKDEQVLIPRDVNILPYMSWWQKLFVLDRTPFKDVARRLEETYDVHVQVNDRKLLERTLSGSIENQNLSVIMDALAQALKVSVRQEGKTIIFGNVIE